MRTCFELPSNIIIIQYDYLWLHSRPGIYFRRLYFLPFINLRVLPYNLFPAYMYSITKYIVHYVVHCTSYFTLYNHLIRIVINLCRQWNLKFEFRVVKGVWYILYLKNIYIKTNAIRGEDVSNCPCVVRIRILT